MFIPSRTTEEYLCLEFIPNQKDFSYSSFSGALPSRLYFSFVDRPSKRDAAPDKVEIAHDTRPVTATYRALYDYERNPKQSDYINKRMEEECFNPTKNAAYGIIQIEES